MTNSWDGGRHLKDALHSLDPERDAVLTVRIRGDQSSLVDVLEHGFLPQLVSPAEADDGLDDYVALGGEWRSGTEGGEPLAPEHLGSADTTSFGGEGGGGTIGGDPRPKEDLTATGGATLAGERGDEESHPDVDEGEGKPGTSKGNPSPSFSLAYVLAEDERRSRRGASAGAAGHRADVVVQLTPDDGDEAAE
jgi:hypothetical protein